MKIGIVVPFFTPYIMGNEYELAASLAKLGASVTIITSRSRAPREKMVSTQYAAPEALPFAVKYVSLLLDVGEIPLAPGSFFEVLRDDYDVLLLQEDYQPICHFAYCAARWKKVPTVLSTERNYTPDGIKGTVLSVFDMTINRPIRRGATVYTAHDRAARDYVEGHLGVRKGRVQVIPIGTDTDFFRYRTGGQHLRDGRFKVLTVARLHPYKGLDHLIRAMDIVHKKDDGIVLYIKGNGPQAEQLKGLAAGLGLQDVRPVPGQAGGQRPDAAHVFGGRPVLPAEHRRAVRLRPRGSPGLLPARALREDRGHAGHGGRREDRFPGAAGRPGGARGEDIIAGVGRGHAGPYGHGRPGVGGLSLRLAGRRPPVHGLDHVNYGTGEMNDVFTACRGHRLYVQSLFQPEEVPGIAPRPGLPVV